MEEVIKNKSFVNLKSDVEEMLNVLKEIENDVNEDVYLKYNLKKYEMIPEGSDEEVLLKYETLYDQFAEVVINKDNSIRQTNKVVKKINEMMNYLDEFGTTGDFQSIQNKERQNADQLKKCINGLVDKMLEKEGIIYDRKEKEFELQTLQRKQKHIQKRKQLYDMKFSYYNQSFQTQQNIKDFHADVELQKFINSIDSMKEWSGKQEFNIIFDSNKNGDEKEVLKNKIINKNQLYFIHFDNNNNIFGGYINNTITPGKYVTDPNAFVCSFVRNGLSKNKKYNIKKGKESNAFYLYSNGSSLYQFGASGGCIEKDILVNKIGNGGSYCSLGKYSYNGEQTPLRDSNHPNKFSMKRILVIQMV